MATAQVYNPTVYDSLPSLYTASECFKQLQPQAIIEREISQLFLKHNVYNELSICLLHRHFNLSPAEKLVEFGAVSSPWQYGQDDSSVVGGSVVPRSWAFHQGSLFPFEFGYNQSTEGPVYRPLPDKPAFFTELHDVLVKHGLQNLLGLTLNVDGDAVNAASNTLKLEKTFDRANVVFTIGQDSQIAAKETIPAQWAFSGVGDFRVPFKKLVCFATCYCSAGPPM